MSPDQLDRKGRPVIQARKDQPGCKEIPGQLAPMVRPDRRDQQERKGQPALMELTEPQATKDQPGPKVNSDKLDRKG